MIKYFLSRVFSPSSSWFQQVLSFSKIDNSGNYIMCRESRPYIRSIIKGPNSNLAYYNTLVYLIHIIKHTEYMDRT